MPLDTVHVGQYALRFEERELSSSVGCSTNGWRISGSPFLGHKCGGMPQSVVCTAAGLAYSPHPWLLEILQAWEFHPPLVLVQLSCGVGWEWTARPTFQVLPTHLSSFRSSPLWATGSRFLLLPVTLRRPRLPPCTNTKLRVLQQPPAPWSLQSVIHGASVFFEFPLSKHHTSLKKRVSSSTTSATSLLAKRGKHQTHMSAEGSNYTT